MRRDLVKQAQRVADNDKIAIRNANRVATSDLDREVKAGTATVAEVADAKEILTAALTNALSRVDTELQRTSSRLLEI
jgi:ribosome recycling factor